MATRAKEATAKADTPLKSKKPLLRTDAPRIKKAAQIAEKYDQVFDALNNERMSAKTAEQLNQCLKGKVALAKLELQYMGMVATLGHKLPIPKGETLKGLIGS